MLILLALGCKTADRPPAECDHQIKDDVFYCRPIDVCCDEEECWYELDGVQYFCGDYGSCEEATAVVVDDACLNWDDWFEGGL